MERIDRSYIDGYRQALLDVREAFYQAVEWGLGRKFNYKMTMKYLDFLIENRAALRDGDGRVLWNGEKFEMVNWNDLGQKE